LKINEYNQDIKTNKYSQLIL